MLCRLSYPGSVCIELFDFCSAVTAAPNCTGSDLRAFCTVALLRELRYSQRLVEPDPERPDRLQDVLALARERADPRRALRACAADRTVEAGMLEQ